MLKYQWRLYFRFTKLLAPYWDKLFLLFLINNLLNLALIISPLFVKALFDYAYPYKDISLLLLLGFTSFALVISLQIIASLSSFLNLYVDQQVHRKLYSLAYSKIQKLPMSFFKDNKVGDLIFRLTQDLEIISQSIQNNVFTFLTSIIKIVLLLVITFSLNPTITVLALLGIPINFLQTHVFAKKLKEMQHENQKLSSVLYSVLDEKITNIKLIKIFAKAVYEVQHFLGKLGNLFLLEQKIIITKTINGFLVNFISQLWALAVMLYSGYCVISGTLTIGGAIAIASYIALLLNPFEKLLQLYTSLFTAQVSFLRIEEILNYPEEDLSIAGKMEMSLIGNVAFRDICFSYDKNVPVLHNLSLTIEPKTINAIVGRSGSGKTSILDLLLRFYAPQSGQILLDGVEIADLSLVSVRRQVCLVSQELSFFSGTIKDNLTYGLSTDVSMDKIVEAVKLADAWEFIEKLPHKYDEILAANAQNLSGGQKQRLAIARAILIEPKIIIFDESTSGLDSETEKYLQNTMQTLKKTATVILIAHRLSAIKNADKIFVLGDEGNIVEQGSFTELLQKKHYFYHLYESQSGGYPIFLEQLRLLIKSAQRYRRPFSMALLNLQNAKALNRQLGEQDFNTLIEKLEFFIKLKLREVDIGGYYKDGELAIVFTETPFAGAQLAMHRLNQELAGQFAGALQLGLALTEFADNDSIEIIFERLRSKKDVV